MRNTTMTYAILTFLFTVTFVISPAFTTFTGFEANQLPIPQIDPPIQPAGYAFSIWGLIYAWLVISAIFGIRKRADDPAWTAPRKSLIISLAVGTPWLWVATQSAVWATILIFVMAVFAILAMIKSPKDFDRWTLQAPVAIYAGWLTAASFVSLGSTMAGYGILFGSLGWAFIGITGALIAAAAVYWQRPAPEYMLTIVWALVGIIIANQGTTPSVVVYASGGISLALALIFWQAINARKSPASSYASPNGTAD